MIRQQLIKLMEEDESYRGSVTAERYIRRKPSSPAAASCAFWPI
jgi:hypothetical protein